MMPHGSETAHRRGSSETGLEHMLCRLTCETGQHDRENGLREPNRTCGRCANNAVCQTGPAGAKPRSSPSTEGREDERSGQIHPENN